MEEKVTEQPAVAEPQQPQPSTPPPSSSLKKYFPIAIVSVLVLLIIIGIASFLLLGAAKSKISNSLLPNYYNNGESNKMTGDSNTSASEPTVAPNSKTDVLDPTKLPLGDGKVSSNPKKEYVYSCTQDFRGGGAAHVGDWIHGDTWDMTAKTHVEGNIKWPNAQFTITTNGSNRTITGNGLPIDTTTGIFPISSTDPAYQIDRNPNSIKQQDVSINLPLNPSFATSPSCVPMGMIGVATNGVAIYNALDDAGRDAVAHEVQDLCDGHPQSQGEYHYHGPSDCLPNEKENNTLIGYALDGYGIYSMYDANGHEITNSDLDACHGTTSEIEWNGKKVNMYHYVLTREYPYTIGCFKGTVAPGVLHMGGGQQVETQNHHTPPSGQKPPPIHQ